MTAAWGQSRAVAGGLEREAGQKGNRSNPVAVSLTELGTQAESFKGQNPRTVWGHEE